MKIFWIIFFSTSLYAIQLDYMALTGSRFNNYIGFSDDTCYVDLISTRLGTVWSSFDSWGKNACEKAMSSCQKRLKDPDRACVYAYHVPYIPFLYSTNRAWSSWNKCIVQRANVSFNKVGTVWEKYENSGMGDVCNKPFRECSREAKPNEGCFVLLHYSPGAGNQGNVSCEINKFTSTNLSTVTTKFNGRADCDRALKECNQTKGPFSECKIIWK